MIINYVYNEIEYIIPFELSKNVTGTYLNDNIHTFKHGELYLF